MARQSAAGERGERRISSTVVPTAEHMKIRRGGRAWGVKNLIAERGRIILVRI